MRGSSYGSLGLVLGAIPGVLLLIVAYEGKQGAVARGNYEQAAMANEVFIVGAVALLVGAVIGQAVGRRWRRK